MHTKWVRRWGRKCLRCWRLRHNRRQEYTGRHSFQLWNTRRRYCPFRLRKERFPLHQFHQVNNFFSHYFFYLGQSDLIICTNNLNNLCICVVRGGLNQKKPTSRDIQNSYVPSQGSSYNCFLLFSWSKSSDQEAAQGSWFACA